MQVQRFVCRLKLVSPTWLFKQLGQKEIFDCQSHVIDQPARALCQVSKLFRLENPPDEPMHKQSKSRGVLHVPAIHIYHINFDILIPEIFTAGKSPALLFSHHASLFQR